MHDYMCMYSCDYIFLHMLYTVNFLFGSIIFSRGGYNNAQPTKSYFGFFIWQRHFLGMASLGNLSFFTISTSLMPKSKIQKSAAAAAEFFILNFASYHYFFNTEIQNSAVI